MNDRMDRFDLVADRLARRIRDQLLERVVKTLDERAAAPELLLTAEQTATYLGIHRTKVYELARSGKLPVLRLGDSARPRLRFDRAELVRYLRSADAQGNGRPKS